MMLACPKEIGGSFGLVQSRAIKIKLRNDII